ncbi:MAG: DinB family protein, partial [Nocardioides sp.]|nr:DinB family protein [Nocardioides sp.]
MGEEKRAFVDEDLSGARFERCWMAGAVIRGSGVSGMEIDDPWLLEDGGSLVVNGVDVAAYVDAELDRRFPGRSLRQAASAEDLRLAWGAVERAWAGAVDRALVMPAGAMDVSVAGEWSFAQTLRHLVMATDTWLRRSIQGLDEPYHPIGQPHAEYATDGFDLTVFSETSPSFDRVLEVRGERLAMVREFLADLTDEQLQAA